MSASCKSLDRFALLYFICSLTVVELNNRAGQVVGAFILSFIVFCSLVLSFIAFHGGRGFCKELWNSVVQLKLLIVNLIQSVCVCA